METIKNQFFQDHHTYPKKKLLKTSPFKDTTYFSKLKTVKN